MDFPSWPQHLFQLTIIINTITKVSLSTMTSSTILEITILLFHILTTDTDRSIRVEPMEAILLQEYFIQDFQNILQS
jgi:hypothetical protein